MLVFIWGYRKMLKREQADKDEVIFETEIISFKNRVIQHRWVNNAVISAAVALPMLALAVPSTPRFIKGISLLLGSVFAFSSYSISNMRSDEEKIYSSYLEINKEQYKKSIANELATAQIFDEITNQINLRKSMVTLPPQAQLEYGDIYGIPQGLYSDLFDVAEDEPVIDNSHVKTSYVSGKSGVTTSKVTVNPLTVRYPQYIKEGSGWIEDLINLSLHPDMNKRHNHHFGIFGNTQDGKTTLCGYMVKMMSEKAQTTVVCHDAKSIPNTVGINNWMCEFTTKVDGYENTDTWLDVIDDYSQNQLTQANQLGNNLSDLPELVIIQDEANTVYGCGKGDGRYINGRMANNLVNSWKFAITNLAGCKGHMILMGQSPLRGDIGISTVARDNMCIVTMGSSCNYVLDPKNRTNFIKNPDKQMIDSLTVISQTLTKQGVRFALVIPTRGQPFIGLIPNLNKAGGDEGDIKNTPDTPDIPDIPNTPPDSNKDIIDNIREWISRCRDEGLTVDKEDIRNLWLRLTGEVLTDNGLDYLISILM